MNAECRQVLGDRAFIERMTASQPQRLTITFDELVDECCRLFGIASEAIVSKSRARNLSPARAWLSRQAVSRGIATTSAVARHLNRSEAAIRGLMTRHPVPSSD